MDFFSDLSVLGWLGQLLLAVGLAGVLALCFGRDGRPRRDRSLALVCALIAAGGVALMWRVDKLENADRDLTPGQQLKLSVAAGQFPSARFEVLTSSSDREAHALATKIANAIAQGREETPSFDDQMQPRHVGVVLIFASGDIDFSRRVADTIGRALIEARIGVISQRVPEMGEHTVRIVVGPKH